MKKVSKIRKEMQKYSLFKMMQKNDNDDHPEENDDSSDEVPAAIKAVINAEAKSLSDSLYFRENIICMVDCVLRKEKYNPGKIVRFSNEGD